MTYSSVVSNEGIELNKKNANHIRVGRSSLVVLIIFCSLKRIYFTRFLNIRVK